MWCLSRVKVPYDSPAGGGLGNFTPIHPIDQLSQLPFYGDEICSIIGKHLLEKSSSVDDFGESIQEGIKVLSEGHLRMNRL